MGPSTFFTYPVAFAASSAGPARAGGLGETSGTLPRDHLTLESAIQVDLSKETVRLPLYRGKANGQTVWYVPLDASDAGLAHDLGVNYAPKLANLAIGCPECVQSVTLESPTPQQNRFGQAAVDFQGAPDFGPTRVAEPGPNGFPLTTFQPGAVAGPGYSPFIRIAGSNVVYDAPIVATGEGPFDVDHHTNTGDRVLGIHIAPPSPPGQYLESWADLLFVKGFDAGRPIVYISTDAGQPLTAVLERSTYVPALDKAVQQGLNERQIDENVVFNLAATRPDLLTGVDPPTGNPAPYGSVGVDINCAVIGFIDKAPTANLADPVPNSQFPPR